MGTSTTIIASRLQDFPALAERLSFRRTGEVSGQLPPVGYSESRGQALIWIDQDRRDDLAMIDYAALSKAAPIWVLSVYELEPYSVLERYENGVTTCAVWSLTNGLSLLDKCGTCPFHPEEFNRHCLGPATREALGIGAGPSTLDFDIPLMAFRDMTGVDYDGPETRSVESAEAAFPEEAKI